MIICALDASKAFDKVNGSRLFNLLQGKLSNELLRSMINYFEQLTLTVQINRSFSKAFKTKYGVKQGGPCTSSRCFVFLLSFLRASKSYMLRIFSIHLSIVIEFSLSNFFGIDGSVECFKPIFLR
jgi:hypothetical protein